LIEVIWLNILQAVLQTAVRNPAPAPATGASFIFGTIMAVSVLLITVGVFYVLLKLGGLLDAMKEKAEAAKK
jgi:hypothetical protein